MQKILAVLLVLCGIVLTACTSAPPIGNVPVRMMGAGTSMPSQGNQPLYPTGRAAVPVNNNPPMQSGPRVVSVSPYEGRSRNVTPPPIQQQRMAVQQPRPVQQPAPVYRPPQQQPVMAQPVYRPAVTAPRPIAVTQAQKNNLSITDVIDATIKNAPDEQKIATAVPQRPLDKHDIMPPTVNSTQHQSATTVVREQGHQPSKQAIASLGGQEPRFYWPVRGNVISTFGAKGSGKQNDGINITAPKGTAVKAAAAGLVVYSGQDLGGLGNLILVRHSGGFHTAYAHVDNPLVKTGDRVAVGQAIANIGKSGNVTTPQLHFEIREGKKPVNPDSYLPRA